MEQITVEELLDYILQLGSKIKIIETMIVTNSNSDEYDKLVELEYNKIKKLFAEAEGDDILRSIFKNTGI